MFNRQSKIGNRNLINPLAALGNEDRQFFHHELRLADGADHVSAGGGVPFLRHFFASVTTPALNVGVPGKNMPINFRQVAIVQP
jgi:hypothetical protein